MVYHIVLESKAIYDSFRIVCQTKWALSFGRNLAHREEFRVTHAANHVLRLLAERVEHLILLHVLLKL